MAQGEFRCDVLAKSENGHRINSVETWLQYGGPKKGSKQWKEFRSALELARSWLRDDVPAMPVEYSHLLKTRRETRGFNPTLGLAEVEIAFDDLKPPRNSDMVVIGESKEGRAVLAVEAKADEPFAKLVSDELKDLAKTSGKPERIRRLAAAVLNREVDDHVRSLRYQLLHSLAATAVEARKHQANVGVLLIHEFISLTLNFDDFTRNANDLKTFVNSIPGWEHEQLATGRQLPPIMLTGNEHIPNDQLVTIGKVRTLIPLTADSREMPALGFDKKSHQFLAGSSTQPTDEE